MIEKQKFRLANFHLEFQDAIDFAQKGNVKSFYRKHFVEKLLYS